MSDGQDLALYRETATALVAIVQGVVDGYRERRTVSQGQLQVLRVEAEKAVREARARAHGELARANIEELARTAKLIESYESSPAMQALFMEQLETLHNKLRRLLDEF